MPAHHLAPHYPRFNRPLLSVRPSKKFDHRFRVQFKKVGGACLYVLLKRIRKLGRGISNKWDKCFLLKTLSFLTF